MEGNYANIIVDISHEKVDRTFQYKIPEAMKPTLEVGMSVNIPFGKGNKLIKGYVMEITNTAEYDVGRLKEIASVCQQDVGVETDAIKLAWWMKENYGSTMITALKTVLPVKTKMKALEKKTIRRLLSPEETRQLCEQCEKKHQVAKVRLLRELAEEELLPQKLVTGKLNVTTQTIQSLEKAGVLAVESQQVYRNPVQFEQSENRAKLLTEEQKQIADRIVTDYQNGIRDQYLLYGVTGSGKTEVYMDIIQRMVAMGKSAIVLIPEIALTYQTVLRFYKRFGDRVSVVNSKLSAGEKYDQFERARNGEIDVMIGPRSALFTPFPNLGLIVIDEEHEASYKSETMPRYHAREVAREICRLKKASLLLGSATPSLEAFYDTKMGTMKLLSLPNRLSGGELSTVYVVDLREELKSGNRSIFSRQLQELLQDRLDKKEQSMLFLNRRGFAGFVSCRACGHVMKCPHCDVSLSEHRNGKLVCHYCGYEQPGVKICPECGSKYILGFRAGTQQIEDLLHRHFPQARVLRMDADTTKSKDSYETILSQFANREADILVGTQMIVKGHDFPDVTLMGILAADMSLHAADYRAAERTFQLITQAAGRAGRGKRPGEVIIQTYQPEHYAIIHAANQDYDSFYEEEIAYRDLMLYPPVANMMAVMVSTSDEQMGMAMAEECIGMLKRDFAWNHPIIVGPAAASIGKINDVYRTVFYIKHRHYETLITMKDALEEYIKQKAAFQKAWDKEHFLFDFNPMNAF